MASERSNPLAIAAGLAQMREHLKEQPEREPDGRCKHLREMTWRGMSYERKRQLIQTVLDYRLAERPSGVSTPELMAGALAHEKKLASDTLQRLLRLLEIE